MAIHSWTMNQAVPGERQRKLAAEAARERRIAEAEQAMGAANKQMRYRDAALAVLVFLFALLAFGLGPDDAEARRVRGIITDPEDVGVIETGASVDWLRLP